MNLSEVRVAVIGVGYLGRFHALIYGRMSGVRLVGVVDADAARAHAVAAEAGCAVFPDVASLLGQVDAVSVVVPTSLHLEVARPFLEQGVHVLLEKPIAATQAEGMEIVRLARQSGAWLQIGHLERFNAGVMELARRIDRPRFIEAQRMSPFVQRGTDVDVVSDLMIHDIDIILSLVGAPLERVSAVGTPVLTHHVDIANARLEFANGAVANVIASRVSEQKARRIRVFQPQAYLSLDFIAQTLDSASPEGGDWPGAAPTGIRRERLNIDPVKPLDTELAAFIDCVTEGRSPIVTGEVGLEALAVALQVRDEIAARPLAAG